MKFVVDNMLGRLAKYLRFLGYDTYYSNKTLADDELIKISEEEGRTLITRDRVLASRAKNSFLVTSMNSVDQLKEVIKKFNLNSERMLTRCSVCNTELEKVDKESVLGKVPDNVYRSFNEFYHCPGCGRYYWFGSHAANIENMIRTVEKDEH